MARQSLGAAPREQGSEVKGAASGGLYLDSESAEERSEEMIEVKLLGPKDDQWAVISLKDQSVRLGTAETNFQRREHETRNDQD